MSHIRSLTEIKREGVEFLGSLRSDSPHASKEAGLKLVAEASSFGLNLRDYLTVKIDPRLSADEGIKASGLSGYEAALAHLGLPVKDDLKQGVFLQAAAETFQTFPGVRALFPEVIDDVVQWKYKQTNFEQVAPMLAGSRTISGIELLSTVVDDAAGDYDITREIAEGARIPVWSIRASEKTVKFYKHGVGFRTTYEFNRRVSLDIMTPYINRALRQADISKVKWATSVLLNGDGLNAAATEVDQSSFNSTLIGNATNGLLSYKHLLAWLVARAKTGYPIDTVVGNYDSYLQWLMLFAVPTSNNTRTDAENLAATGFRMQGVPMLTGTVDFVLSTTAPANKLVGFSRGDTLEELIESGSLIQESERSVQNQTVDVYRTQNSGYRIVFPGTREVFDYSA
ncbi:hypothetical protein [Inquilinus limosus]|uniref:Capsid protein n=1 Tax=Inquilinus limosus MP06 TaxID=1398085 RepID=A0A0A0DDL4_9PROT|nr:hypothetical protein [Inquilinus limosus]KGM36135.1 hypothetical protein P409_00370 [Inquilinus limosus MP06]